MLRTLKETSASDVCTSSFLRTVLVTISSRIYIKYKTVVQAVMNSALGQVDSRSLYPPLCKLQPMNLHRSCPSIPRSFSSALSFFLPLSLPRCTCYAKHQHPLHRSLSLSSPLPIDLLISTRASILENHLREPTHCHQLSSPLLPVTSSSLLFSPLPLTQQTT